MSSPLPSGAGDQKEHSMNTGFWTQAIAWQGSVTPRVVWRVVGFTAFACLVWYVDRFGGCNLDLPIAPYEAAGAVLGVLLVLRTNAGYDRWWEGRKLWGGIVNQTRNLAMMAVEYGPRDVTWRNDAVRLAAAFPHLVRSRLRGERDFSDVERLLAPEDAAIIEAAGHPALRVSQLLAEMFRRAVEAGEMDRFFLLQADRERALLIDHLGACERILKSPLPGVYAIKVRRFLFLFLATLPLVLLEQAGAWTPAVVLLVAYSLLALDQIGVELENPFSRRHLSHLPLDDICRTIEENVLETLHDATACDQPTMPERVGR